MSFSAVFSDILDVVAFRWSAPRTYLDNPCGIRLSTEAIHQAVTHQKSGATVRVLGFQREDES